MQAFEGFDIFFLFSTKEILGLSVLKQDFLVNFYSKWCKTPIPSHFSPFLCKIHPPDINKCFYRLFKKVFTFYQKHLKISLLRNDPPPYIWYLVKWSELVTLNTTSMLCVSVCCYFHSVPTCSVWFFLSEKNLNIPLLGEHCVSTLHDFYSGLVSTLETMWTLETGVTTRGSTLEELVLYSCMGIAIEI